MRGVFISTLFFFLSNGLFSQITVNRIHADLGMIDAEGIRYADFIFSNKGKKKDYILRIDVPREYTSLIKTKTLVPDSSTVLRIQYNPRKTGKFAEEIDVYVSSSMTPIKISLSGEITEMPTDASPSCPDFSNTNIAEQISFPLKIEVIDFVTRKPVPGAMVRITAHGQDIERIKVNSQGKAVRKIPLGYYYFITSAENYETDEFDTFVNKRVDYLLIELQPKEIPAAPDLLANEKDSIPEIVITISDKPETIVIDNIPVNVIPQSDSSLTLVIPKDTITDDFSVRDYAPNNIVFLVDISASMNTKGKLNILKAAMIKMAEKLRPCDRISLVAYSSNAEVIIPASTGEHKDEIIEKIKSLKGGGTTNGAAGLKAAYELATDNYIKDGNNQIIMVTDGIFDIEGQKILQTVRKYRNAEIITSVVGIKTDAFTEGNLQRISNEGKGNIISIQSYEQGEIKLLDEMKFQSKIKK